MIMQIKLLKVNGNECFQQQYGYSMRNESSGRSEVPHSAVQSPLHPLPYFLLILAKRSGTERVALAKALLGFVAVAAAQLRLSTATEVKSPGILTGSLSCYEKGKICSK